MTPELVVFTRLQASSSTSFYRERFAATHVHIGKDAWPNARKTEERQRRLSDEHLRAGGSVVVDNNPTPPPPRAARRDRTRGRRAHRELRARDHRRGGAARNAGREGRARIIEVGIYSVAKQLVAPGPDEGFFARFEGRLADAGFVVAALKP